MKHYINKNKEIFGFELDGSQDHLITKDMVKISIEEINKINQAKEDEIKQTLEYKINEAKAYLLKTNHKFLIGYIPKENEDLEIIRQKRDESLLFIRANS